VKQGIGKKKLAVCRDDASQCSQKLNFKLAEMRDKKRLEISSRICTEPKPLSTLMAVSYKTLQMTAAWLPDLLRTKKKKFAIYVENKFFPVNYTDQL